MTLDSLMQHSMLSAFSEEMELNYALIMVTMAIRKHKESSGNYSLSEATEALVLKFIIIEQWKLGPTRTLDTLTGVRL